MRLLRRFLPLLALLGVALSAPGQRASTLPQVDLAPAPRASVQKQLDAASAGFEGWDAAYAAALSVHGDVGPLLRHLEARTKAPEVAPAAKRELLRGWMHVLHREGLLDAALARADEALALSESDDVLLRRAQLLDALGRAEDALQAYEKLRGSSKDPAVIGRVELRIALLDVTRPAKGSTASAGGAGGSVGVAVPLRVAAVPLRAAGSSTLVARSSGSAARSVAGKPKQVTVEGPPSALFRYASAEGRERDVANRAAVVLAMLGRPKEALQLFRTAGEGSDLFRQEVRMAEWALAADEPALAQEHAWKAREAAALKRDRLYALTVLVEAHRADESLAKLIERFAAAPDLDAESRSTWIDLLRETARVDEALALFRRGGEGGFTPEMRRELLEMCREAGRDEELVATYRELIEAEPARVEWREGLSRWLLEHGRRADAEAVWSDAAARFEDVATRLEAARTTRDLGLDELARSLAESCAGLPGPTAGLEARMFLFEFELRGGRVEDALAQLEAFDREAPPQSPLRVQLAEAFERIGNKQRAVDVLEGIRALRGADEAEEDLEMRLAWLYSEVGREEQALERWRNLWRRVSSLSRRRQVEDRMMAVAARLGKLSDIAVELEEKLADGVADDRDAGLLVRLYMKVGDPVSAAEVVEEHMKRKGGAELEALKEKSRVYLGGKDYYHFEKTIRKLVELDPEGRGDHLRQLAMSNLERGRPQEARAVLEQLAAEENPSDAAEFEAGVLSLAGLHEDAARTYRRGLAAHPERIDTYLLLGNTLRTLRQTERAVGMFQYLAENADKDDLFTVAIDGVLNMRAKEPQLRWALRVALERLAGRHDKMYLYQLCADLSEELNDTPARMRALEGSLAIAAEQRAQVLRELMDVAQGPGTNSYTIVNGVMVQRRTGGNDRARLAYGRRLIGLGDLVPPQVYLELGEAFLGGGEVSNAAKTFSMARDVPDYGAFQRQVAQSFENAQYVEDALAVYERAMASSGLDVSLLLKTGELHEQLGRDGRAAELYARGLEVLLARHPLSASVVEERKNEDDFFSWSARNVGEFERYFGALRSGFMAAASAEQARALFDAQRALLSADIAELARSPEPQDGPKRLAGAPRVRHRAEFLRQLGLRFGRLAEVEEFDLALLRALPDDDKLLGELCKQRAALGFTGAAAQLVERSGRGAEQARAALSSIGLGAAAPSSGALAPSEVIARLLPLLIEGDRERASVLLRSAQLGETTQEDLPQLQLLVSAALFLDDDASVVQLGRQAVRAIVQHAQGYEEQRQVDALLKRAKSALDLDSYGLVVDALVESLVARKEAFQSYSYSLRQVQKDLGRPLFTAEQIEKQIEECLPDRVYLLSSLLELCPADARLELAQRVWPKVPATSKADVALDLFQAAAHQMTPALAEFVVGGFEEGLEKLEEPRVLTYQLRNALERAEENAAVVARLADAAARKHPAELTFGAVLAAAQAKLGQKEAALKSARAALSLAPQEDEEWNVRSAGELLVSAFVPEYAAELTALLDELEAAGVKCPAFREMRLQSLEKLGDAAGQLAVLERALASEPEDVDLLRALYSEVSSSDDEPRRLALLARLAEQDDENTHWREALVRSWRSLRNPVRALEAKRAGGEQPAAEERKPEGRKLEAATLPAVAKSVREGRLEDARAAWRRTWRRYGQEGNGRVFVYYGGAVSEQKWPAEPKETGEQRSRGGLEALRLDKPDEAKPAEQPSAHEVVAGLEFGLEELRRQVRSLSEGELQSSRALLRGLQRAEVAARGREAALADWLARVREGRAGTVERALLLSYYEDHIDALGPQDRAVLAELAPAVHPLDGAQLRALARLYAKLGDSARASRIYQWCATLTTSSRWGGSGRGSISAHELLDEVPKFLQGADLIAAVDAILARCNPGGFVWEREEYVQLVIETWLDVAGAAEARKRCATELDAVLDLGKGIMRQPALDAARVFAASGDFERAARALEIALCRFDDGQVRFDPEDAYSIRYKLQPQYLSTDNARKLFPAELGAGLDSGAWVRLATAKVAEWDAAGRLHPQAANTLLATLAVRLQQRGLAAEARPLLERVEARSGGPLGNRHLAIDLARLLGDEARARALEDELLARNGLNPERLPEVLARIGADQGAARELELGLAAAVFAPHPQLVERLIVLAAELGRTEERAKLEALRTDSLAAAKELDAAW